MIVVLDLVYLFFVMFFATFAVPTGAVFFLFFYASSALSFSSLFLLIVVAFVASVLGDVATFFLARRFRDRFQSFICSHKHLRDREEGVEKFFHRHGGKSIFLTKFFVAGLGPFFNYYAGLKRFPVGSFLVAVLFGELVYAVGYALLGFVYRDTWQDLISLLNDFFVLVVVVLVLSYFVYHLFLHYRDTHRIKRGGVNGKV